MMGGGCLQLTFAEEVSVLPALKSEAQAQQQNYADGKLAKEAKLGALGNKSVIDTPFSVTTYTAKTISDTQAATVSEVLKNDPSIRETTNSGHLNENIQIRGFSVGFEDYNMNGLYGMAPTGHIPTDIIDSVTVLKGPNALVAGMAPAGSVGGVVMAQTKRANQDLIRVSASYEDDGYYKSGFDVARRLGNNKEFGVRVGGSYGQGEHIIDGMDDTNSTGVVALDYTTDKLKLNFDAYAVRDKRDNGSPVMVSMGTIKQVIAAPSGDSNFFPNIHGEQNSQYLGVSGEYKFSPDLKVFGGAGYTEKEYSGHIFGTRMIVHNATTGAASSQYYRVGYQEHAVAANLGLEGKFDTGAIQHTLGLRADYLTRNYWQHSAATSNAFNTNLYNPIVDASEQMPTSYPTIVPYADNRYVSYTLTDQMSMLDDKLQVILGARYQDIDTKNLYKKTKYSSDKLSPSLGLVVKPFGEDLSFYASYVEGLSEGVTVSDITYPTATNKGETLAPYQTKQYELGTKYQVGSWLNTLALYQIEKPEVYQDTVTKAVKDDAETRSRGIEFSTAGQLTEDLSLMANLAYIDAEYVKSGTASQVGNTVIGTPDFTAGLGMDYKIPVVDGLSVNARASYVSEQYLNTDNSLELPDYTILDLGAKYATKIGGVNTTFRANVNNLTDEKYWSGVFGSNYAILGAGRTYKLGVTFDF
ncbi:TonB-dependent siderophore receptor [Acinetobacter johnsonii]|uniref:TonB-dependent siderophore receptor n=3 Tax=Bacteria TaxID=2 RepID=A0AA42MSH0_ACIJO|nr:TonB-dependent siderophore receptor [Acinetobacter johnsonii]MDH0968399.1 TonB-dependent siderophore receptor [Acinetobacter johnsonii]QYA55777.1 TonB-dependent siderophore receptor [Acinetobacter johnsonii]WQN48057.1 TonB-dependent siderophore receptor [Acinetobacter johnsonii]